MNLNELDFDYPEELVATERRTPSRIMHVREGEGPCELADQDALVGLMAPGDVLVLNDTRVLRRRARVRAARWGSLQSVCALFLCSYHVRVL